MRVGKGVALGFLLAGMCAAPVRTPKRPYGDIGSTYTTWVRDDLPSPAGTGDAPLAGSLGPPQQMVEPSFPGVTTLTREGSSGPPVRSSETAAEGVPSRIQLQGPDADAWRGRAGGPRGPGRAKEEEGAGPGKPTEGEPDR